MEPMTAVHAYAIRGSLSADIDRRSTPARTELCHALSRPSSAARPTLVPFLARDSPECRPATTMASLRPHLHLNLASFYARQHPRPGVERTNDRTAGHSRHRAAQPDGRIVHLGQIKGDVPAFLDGEDRGKTAARTTAVSIACRRNPQPAPRFDFDSHLAVEGRNLGPLLLAQTCRQLVTAKHVHDLDLARPCVGRLCLNGRGRARAERDTKAHHGHANPEWNARNESVDLKCLHAGPEALVVLEATLVRPNRSQTVSRNSDRASQSAVCVDRRVTTVRGRLPPAGASAHQTR